MKKTKLLTSLAALALVLSVGACNEPTEETTTEDTSVVETTTETETTTEDTSEDGTTSESTSEGSTSSESSSEDGSTSDTTQNPGGENEEAKKKAADLEEVQEAITGLGVDYFSSWDAYKYTFTGDYEEERLLTTKDNYTYGYSFDDYSKTYYVDGVSYTIENGQYTKGTASSYIYTFNFSEDNYDAADALDTISEATIDDIDEITIDDDTYTVTNTVVDDWGVLGCYTYQNEYVIKISEATLVSVTINQTTTKEAGSIDTSAYTSTNKEAIECVDPEDITLDVIKAAGFDEELWREPTELEIAQAILESVSEVSSLAELGAVHVEGYDDDYDETTTMDMTTDSNGDLYGVWEVYDSWYETDTFYYYYQGVRYELEIASNGEEERDTTDIYLGNLAELLSDYDDALDAAPEKDEIEEGDFELTTTANGYELKVTISGGYGYASWSADLTIKTDLEFNLTGIEYYQDEDYYYSVDQITYATVTAAMSDFVIKDWLGYTPNSVTNMLSDIEENSNYIMDIEYMLYESDYYYSQPSSVSLSLVWDYDTMLYATKDSCIVYYGYWYQYGFSYSFGVMDINLYVNTVGGDSKTYTQVYVMDENAYYTTDLVLSATLEGAWQDNVPNLTQLADYKGAFEINQTGTTSLGYTEGYAVDESAGDLLNSICTCEGYSWLYDDYFKGYCRNYPLTANNLYYMYYYTAYEELQVYYRSNTYLYYGYLDSETVVYWGERYDLSAEIYNVGQVDNTQFVAAALEHANGQAAG